jgi:hypothetical protein
MELIAYIIRVEKLGELGTKLPASSIWSKVRGTTVYMKKEGIEWIQESRLEERGFGIVAIRQVGRWLTMVWSGLGFGGKHIPFCKIWGFHGGDYEEWCLLGCYAVKTSNLTKYTLVCYQYRLVHLGYASLSSLFFS